MFQTFLPWTNIFCLPLINLFASYAYFLFLFEFKLMSNIKCDYIIDACHGKLCKDVHQLAQ